MKFITIRDLRGNTARIRKDLEAEGEVVITANGRPFAVMTRVKPDKLEEEILAIRRGRAFSRSAEPDVEVYLLGAKKQGTS